MPSFVHSNLSFHNTTTAGTQLYCWLHLGDMAFIIFADTCSSHSRGQQQICYNSFTAAYIFVRWLSILLQVLILPTVEGDSRSADDAQGGADRPHHQSRGATGPVTGPNLLPAGAIPA